MFSADELVTPYSSISLGHRHGRPVAKSMGKTISRLDAKSTSQTSHVVDLRGAEFEIVGYPAVAVGLYGYRFCLDRCRALRIQLIHLLCDTFWCKIGRASCRERCRGVWWVYDGD